MIKLYLLIDELSPEPSHGFLIRILWQNGIAFPSFLNVLKYNKWLRDWFPVVEEDRNFLMNWIVFQKQRALFSFDFLFFYIVISNTFQLQSKLNPAAKRALPKLLIASVLQPWCHFFTFYFFHKLGGRLWFDATYRGRMS